MDCQAFGMTIVIRLTRDESRPRRNSPYWDLGPFARRRTWLYPWPRLVEVNHSSMGG
jgi:hypothetical protein